MAQPEEARDPSMEEILASIRKIIAEDEPEASKPAPHLSVVSNEPDAVIGDDGRAKEGLGEQLARKASVKRSQDEAPKAEEIAPPDEADEKAAPVEANADAGEPNEPADQDAIEAKNDAEEGDRLPEAATPVPTDESFDAPAMDRSAEASPVAAALAVGNAQPMSDGDRLLSPQVDKAVHGAFDQLASAIMNDQARTVEDLVKDMMRPMLQHWLDDNLPVLVERLVREEIERVSRGRR